MSRVTFSEAVGSPERLNDEEDALNPRNNIILQVEDIEEARNSATSSNEVSASNLLVEESTTSNVEPPRMLSREFLSTHPLFYRSAASILSAIQGNSSTHEHQESLHSREASPGDTLPQSGQSSSAPVPPRLNRVIPRHQSRSSTSTSSRRRRSLNTILDIEDPHISLYKQNFSLLWKRVLFNETHFAQVLLILQTIFIFVKVSLRNLIHGNGGTSVSLWGLSVLTSWSFILTPFWIAIAVFGSSLFLYMLFDGLKLHKRRLRRIRREQALRQQGLNNNENNSRPGSAVSPVPDDEPLSPASPPPTGGLLSFLAAAQSQASPVADAPAAQPSSSTRFSRRKSLESVDRYLAVSTAVSILVLSVCSVLLCLNLDSITRISYFHILMPIAGYCILQGFANIVFGGFVLKSVKMTKLSLIFWNISSGVLITTFLVLTSLKLDGNAMMTTYLTLPLFCMQLASIMWCIYMMMVLFPSREPAFDTSSTFYRYDNIPLPFFYSLFTMSTVLNVDMAQVYYYDRHQSREEQEVHRSLGYLRKRFDVIVFFLLQIPLFIFFVFTAYYANKQTLAVSELIGIFVPLLVVEFSICIWTTTREKICAFVYKRHEQARREANEEEQEMELPTVLFRMSDRDTNGTEVREEADQQNSRMTTELMLLALHYLQQRNRTQPNRGTDEQGLLELLQQLQQSELPRMGSRNVHSVSRDILDILPTWSYTPRAKSSTASSLVEDTTEAETCTICLEEYKEGEVMKTLQCFHYFHSKCIDDWLSHSNLCPICKHKVDSFQETINDSC